MILSNEDRTKVYIANATCSCISLLGCTFIVIMYVFFEDLRGYGFKLVLVLSVFDIINCISFLLPTYDTENYSVICRTQAFVMNFSTLASVLWTTIIAWSLYKLIVHSDTYILKKMKFFIVGTLILTIGVSATPLITDDYGKNTGWCWIMHKSDINLEFYEKLFLYSVPVTLAIFINTVLYAIIINNLKNTSDSNSMTRLMGKKLRLYPVILIVCYLPYSVKQIIEYTNLSEGDYEFSFTLIVGIFRCLHGLLNTLIYGYTAKVRAKILYLKNNICKWKSGLIENPSSTKMINEENQVNN